MGEYLTSTQYYNQDWILYCNILENIRTFNQLEGLESINIHFHFRNYILEIIKYEIETSSLMKMLYINTEV